MAAATDGKIYAIGGQLTAEGGERAGYVDTVYELDPAIGQWVAKAPMPTARSAGVAVVLDGKIYVAGGRPPRGHDFAAYDPVADSWETLPDPPSQRNHIAGAAIDGKIYVAGGHLGGGFRSDATRYRNTSWLRNESGVSSGAPVRTEVDWSTRRSR